MTDNTTLYKTSELEIAAFLKARGHRLISSRQDGRVVAFEFNGDAASDVGLYFEGVEVSARDLFEAHRSLRALIQQVREYATQTQATQTQIRPENKSRESFHRR